jgi:hypothetical protein
MNLKGYHATSNGQIVGPYGKTLKWRPCTGGYAQVWVRGKTWLVHRLVATLCIPNPDNLPTVNHIDGDKWNNRPDNLEWMSHANQIKHAVDVGLRPKVCGAAEATRKLDEADVLSIWRLKQGGMSNRRIAAISGVAIRQIQKIIRGTAWRHIHKQLTTSYV